MNRNKPCHVPSVEPMPTPEMRVCGPQRETGQVPRGITDVLTIGEEATVFRPVQRALRPTGWTVAHAGSVDEAVAYLQANVAAVVAAEAELAETDLSTLVSSLRRTVGAPEIVFVSWTKVPPQHAISSGFDVIQRPFDHSDVLWALATAWHKWMTQRERKFGGWPCSDA